MVELPGELATAFPFPFFPPDPPPTFVSYWHTTVLRSFPSNRAVRRHARQAVSCMPSGEWRGSSCETEGKRRRTWSSCVAADLCSARVSKREFNPSGEKRDGPCVRDKRNNSVLWADCGRSQLGSARSRGGQATGQSTHGFFCTIDLPLVLLLRGLAMVVPVIAGGGQLARTGGGEGVRGRWLGRSSAS